MRTTETEISQLIAQIAQLVNLPNSHKQAIETGVKKFLTYENAACYGGYRLICVTIEGGTHYGALGMSSTMPRKKLAVFAVMLEGIITGLRCAKDKELI